MRNDVDVDAAIAELEEVLEKYGTPADREVANSQPDDSVRGAPANHLVEESTDSDVPVAIARNARDRQEMRDTRRSEREIRTEWTQPPTDEASLEAETILCEQQNLLSEGIQNFSPEFIDALDPNALSAYELGRILAEQLHTEIEDSECRPMQEVLELTERLFGAGESLSEAGRLIATTPVLEASEAMRRFGDVLRGESGADGQPINTDNDWRDLLLMKIVEFVNRKLSNVHDFRAIPVPYVECQCGLTLSSATLQNRARALMYLNDHIIYFVNHRLNSVGCNRESARRIFREYVQTEQNFMELTRYFDVPTPSMPQRSERWILQRLSLRGTWEI